MSRPSMKTIAPSDFRGPRSSRYGLVTGAVVDNHCHQYLPPLTLQGNPPEHHRFEDPKIPSHITYAFQENAVISENKAFYTMPKDNRKTVDLLFVIASAPVSTLSSPVGGAQSYAGTALAMEHAMMELSDKFPRFFGEEGTND